MSNSVNSTIDCFDYVSDAYIAYGSNVNTSRAFPSIYDGLKPVQRKIILSSYEVAKEKEVGSANIVGRCFTGDTEILDINNNRIKIKDLKSIIEQGKPVYTFSCSEEGNISVTRIINVWETKPNRPLIEVKIDSGESVKCTDDHRFMLRDGTYKEARNLKPFDSLMPGYMTEYDSNQNGTHPVIRRAIYQNDLSYLTKSSSIRDYNVFRLAGEYRYGKKPFNFVFHHIDFNSLNDYPENLVCISNSEHAKIHGHNSFMNYNLKGGLSNRNKENWKNDEYRKFMSDTVRQSNLKQSKQKSLDFYNSVVDKLGNKNFSALDLLTLEDKTLNYFEMFNDKYIRPLLLKSEVDLFDKINRGSSRSFYTMCILLQLIRDNEKLTCHSYKRYAQCIRVNNLKVISYKSLRKLLDNDYLSSIGVKVSKFAETCDDLPEEFLERNPTYYEIGEFRNCVNVCLLIYNNKEIINEKTWLKYRNRNTPHYDKVISKYPEVLNKYNHKVVSITPCKMEPVYDVEVDSVNHNFLLGIGVFVHNCISFYHPHGDCLAGFTKVLLSDYSSKTIEELTKINTDQEIYSVDLKTGKIVKAVATNFREVKKNNLWHITLSDGGSLHCSDNHPILMRDKTYKRAEDLKPGDMVFSLELYKPNRNLSNVEMEFTLVSVVNIKKVEDDEIILYDFTVPEYENMIIKTSENTLLCVHNSGVYKALVNMVNAEDPIIAGHGAFGYKGGLVDIDAAHMRYTAAGLNKFGNALFCEYINYVEKEENELYNEEQKYLPTPVPYSLLNGSVGIGLGATTNIPPCTVSSIEKWITAYLKNNDDSKQIIPKYNFVEDENELKSFNNTGVGTFLFYAKVEKQKDKSIIVSDIPAHVQPNRLLKEFKVELQSRLVTIIQLNDQNNNPMIKIEKAPHVRSISVDEIFERTKKCMMKSVSFKSVVTDGKKAYIFSPRNWLKFTVDNYKSFVVFGLKKELESLEEAILYNQVKKELADLFLQKKTNEEILQYFVNKGIHVKESSLLKWSKKAISTLRSDEIPVEKLLERMQEIKTNILNINEYTLTKIKSIFRI